MTDLVQIDILNIKYDSLFEYIKCAPEVVKTFRKHGVDMQGPFMTETGGASPEFVYFTNWGTDVDEMNRRRRELVNNKEIRDSLNTVMPLALNGNNFLCTKDDKIEGTKKPDPKSRILLEHVAPVGSPLEALDVLRARLQMYTEKYPELFNVINLFQPITFSKPGFFIMIEVKDGNLDKIIDLGKTLRDDSETRQQVAEASQHLSLQSVRLLGSVQDIIPDL